MSSYKHLNDLNKIPSSCSFFRFDSEAVGGYRPRNKSVHSNVSEDRDFQMRVNALFPVGVFTDYPRLLTGASTAHTVTSSRRGTSTCDRRVSTPPGVSGVSSNTEKELIC